MEIKLERLWGLRPAAVAVGFAAWLGLASIGRGQAPAGGGDAAGAVAPAAAAPVSPVAAGSIAPEATAEEILAAFDAAWGELQDYACTLDTTVKRGEMSTESVLSFEFKRQGKRPGLFVSHVLEGDDTGAWVWRGADGRIRAKQDGVLSLIKITMEPSDPRLADVRGATLQDGDWGTMIRQFKKRKAQGWTFKRLPDETVGGTPCAAVEAAGPADAMGETGEVFLFGIEDRMVRARRLYEGETIVDDTVYRDVKLNRGAKDEDFEK